MVSSKILGVDVGSIRVGLAIGVLPEKIVTPVGAYSRKSGEAEIQIARLVEQEKISLLVVGLPLGRDGEENQQCLKVRSFCRRLQRRMKLEISFVDEYLSSVEASTELIQEKGARGSIDALSAALILERYFESV